MGLFLLLPTALKSAISRRLSLLSVFSLLDLKTTLSQ